MRRTLATTLALTLILASCATTTPYGPAHDGLGYTDQQLDANRFRVTFAGNESTERETVENYLLYRAAEVTLERGYDYFVIANRDTSDETSYQQRGGSGFSIGGFGFGGGGWGSSVGVSTGGTADAESEYTAMAEILVYRGIKPEDDRDAFDARQVKENLEDTIERAEAKG